MSTVIDVNKQNVATLLAEATEKPFVIPEYQRPYAWTAEQVETLFEDLLDFVSNEGGTERDGSYFLGSIVSFENEDGEQEIIDGQQRITSLFLLLRAIYTKLTSAPEAERTDADRNFIMQIEQAIWKTDNMTGKANCKESLLNSRVVNNDGNEILRAILETGIADSSARDNYSKNYILFQHLIEEHLSEKVGKIYEFAHAVLKQAILLPITANSQEAALTIFSTLNDRGLPLSDADIFKAKIYNHLDEGSKVDFIERWRELEEQAKNADESIQQLFYYCMFYLRAKDGDAKTTIPGVRKFYMGDRCNKLYDATIIDRLYVILNLWNVINKGEAIENENWSADIDIKQSLDILSSYPNEFWKYPVVIYYVCHRNNLDFKDKFGVFLHKLISHLLICYLKKPTVNAVKQAILKLDVSIVKSDVPKFEFGDGPSVSKDELKEYIKTPHRNTVKMILKILAYEKQKHMLPGKWEIEHIFPQKWRNDYFPQVGDEVVKEKIEHIGNKLPLEKKLNIVAGTGYWGEKKKQYAKSEIVIASEMGNSGITDWNLVSIIERDVRIADEIVQIFERWGMEFEITGDGPSKMISS